MWPARLPLLLALPALAAAAPPLGGTVGPNDHERAFAAWKQAHNKRYADLKSEQRHFAAFVDNARLVDEFNARDPGAEYSLEGPWADMSAAEFQRRVLMPPRVAPESLGEAREHAAQPRVAPLPESWDWTQQKEVVTAVRDQGALGSCWAVSTAENVEGQHALATGKLVQLSPEQLIECDAGVDARCGGQGPKHGTLGCADCGMFGGWPYLAYQHLVRAGGMFSEAEWPYQHNGVYPCMPEGYDREQCGNHDDLYCRKNSTRGQGPGGLCHTSRGAAAVITGWKALSQNETELAAQLVRYGPLSVLLEASSLQNYHSGVWSGGIFGCKPDPDQGVLGLDHAVLLVGYGMEKDFLGRDRPYWRLKNSWGARWGEHGYFRMSRGTATCGVNMAATTAEVAGGRAGTPPDTLLV